MAFLDGLYLIVFIWWSFNVVCEGRDVFNEKPTKDDLKLQPKKEVELRVAKALSPFFSTPLLDPELNFLSYLISVFLNLVSN